MNVRISDDMAERLMRARALLRNHPKWADNVLAMEETGRKTNQRALNGLVLRVVIQEGCDALERLAEEHADAAG